jgi:hypothetical protein
MTQQPVIFDLDRQTVEGFPRNLTQTSRDIRNSTQRRFHVFNEVTTYMATHKTQPDFTNWHSLRHWLENPASKIFPVARALLTDEEKLPRVMPTMILTFQVQTPVVLESLRINIT